MLIASALDNGYLITGIAASCVVVITGALALLGAAFLKPIRDDLTEVRSSQAKTADSVDELASSVARVEGQIDVMLNNPRKAYR